MKTKIFTSLFLGIMLLSFQLSQAQNVLIDGSFDTTKVIYPYCCETAPLNMWNSFKNPGTDANAIVVDGVCNYLITNAGAGAWEVQLEQLGFPLIQGHAYNLSFKVKADADRTFGVFLGEYGGSWTDLLGYERYIQNATTNWQTLSFDFNTDCVFPLHKVSFELGGINTSMYFDDIILTDMGPATTFSIGIIGTSLSGGWDVDVDMLTTDGINYTLTNYPLMPGYVKFRQDNWWCVNWGSSDFPSGTGTQDGWEIPIPKFCNYDITFNRLTGEYSFVNVGNCAPEIGIIGSAVPPNFESDPDVNLLTKDKENYYLKHYYFTDGQAKFRQDDTWDINWGNNAFPEGVAISNGPAIPVTAGVYNVAFNTLTGKYKFSFPIIGIVGSALLGWDTDVDMQTTNGYLNTLTDYPFTDGEVKFRVDHSWDENWGGETFPTGWLWWYGPNIPVPAGTYNVTVDMTTGEYKFVATTCPVAGIRCPDNISTGNSPGVCGAYVDYPEVIPEYNCGGEGITIVQTAGLASGELFPVGTTTNTFVLTNAEGNTATCSFDVIVSDTEPPVITGLSDTYPSLWPPNHKMVPIHLEYSTSDNCKGIITNSINISSNEPVNGLGDGDMTPDWMITDDHHILLRAERSGNGTGRIYTINIVSTDAAGNSSSQLVTVAVPHDQMGMKISDGTFKFGNQVETESFKVNAWPNPSNQNFSLQVESVSTEIIDVFVTDVIGRQIFRYQSTNMKTINFGDDLKPGIYFIKVRQGDYSKTIKVVKQ